MPPIYQLSTAERRDISHIIADQGKIAAIKHLRARLDVRLMTAKRIIDDLDMPDVLTLQSSHRPSRSSGHGWMLLVPVAFLLAGLLLLAGCFFVCSRHDQLESVGDKVSGKVVELRSVSSSGAAPVFEYERKGQTLQWQSPISSKPPAYAVGDSAELYVHPDDANSVLVDDFLHRWLLVLILGGMGGMFCLIAFVTGWMMALS